MRAGRCLCGFLIYEDVKQFQFLIKIIAFFQTYRKEGELVGVEIYKMTSFAIIQLDFPAS